MREIPKFCGICANFIKIGTVALVYNNDDYGGMFGFGSCKLQSETVLKQIQDNTIDKEYKKYHLDECYKFDTHSGCKYFTPIEIDSHLIRQFF